MSDGTIRKWGLDATIKRSCIVTLINRWPSSIEAVWQDALGGIEAAHYVIDRAALRSNEHLRAAIGAMKSVAVPRSETIIAGAERSKSAAALRRMIDWFDDKNVARRREPIIAIGGGALLDMVSFSASIYRRGVPVVKIPTTLIGIVDAALGAKTAVNFYGRKNLVGSFHPAEAVVLEPKFMKSLPRQHISSGVAEILKVGLAKDATLVDLLETCVESLVVDRFQTDLGSQILERAIDLLLASVWSDPWETQLARDLDLGHSLSKVFEESLDPRLTHGEAVALDMAITCASGVRIGVITVDELRRIESLMHRAGLPSDHSGINQAVLRRARQDTIVHRDGSKLFPIVGPIGQISFLPLHVNELLLAQRLLRSDKKRT